MKKIKNKFIWRILGFFPIGLRLKIASKFDDRAANIFNYYGESFKRNTNWNGDVNIFKAILKEKEEIKQDRMIAIVSKIMGKDKA